MRNRSRGCYICFVKVITQKFQNAPLFPLNYNFAPRHRCRRLLANHRLLFGPPWLPYSAWPRVALPTAMENHRPIEHPIYYQGLAREQSFHRKSTEGTIGPWTNWNPELSHNWSRSRPTTATPSCRHLCCAQEHEREELSGRPISQCPAQLSPHLFCQKWQRRFSASEGWPW